MTSPSSSEVRTVATPVGDARVDVRTGGADGGGPPSCSATAPAAASAPRDLVALADGAAGEGHRGGPRRAAVARRRPQGRPRRRRRSTGRGSPCSSDLAVTGPLRRRRPQSAGARVACRTATAVGRRRRARARLPAAPAGPAGEVAAAASSTCRRAGLPTLVLQGSADPFGGPAEHPGRDRAARASRRGRRPLASGCPVAARRPVLAAASWRSTPGLGARGGRGMTRPGNPGRATRVEQDMPALAPTRRRTDLDAARRGPNGRGSQASEREIASMAMTQPVAETVDERNARFERDACSTSTSCTPRPCA